MRWKKGVSWPVRFDRAESPTKRTLRTEQRLAESKISITAPFLFKLL